MRQFNGLIGVRPDRGDRPHLAVADFEGESIGVDHTGRPMLHAARVVGEEPTADGHTLMRVMVSDERQAQQFIGKLRSTGQTVTIERREHRSVHLDTGHIHMQFGGEVALREIGRVALNFVAHEWPELARKRELDAFKNYVKGLEASAASPSPVWWSPTDAFPIPVPKFHFGHQILVAVAKSGQLLARVRLFGTLDFTVHFADFPVRDESAVMFDIDPEADHPPDDLVRSTLGIGVAPNWVARPMVGGLSDLDHLKSAIAQLLNKVSARQNMLVCEALAPRLNATCLLGDSERFHEVASILADYPGVVLFLVRHAVRTAAQSITEVELQPLFEPLVQCLLPDPTAANGLSEPADALVSLATQALALSIATELSQGAISLARLGEFVNGLGASIVAKAVFDQWLRALGSNGELEPFGRG